MADCHARGETRIQWAPRPDGLEESVQFTPGYNCPVTGGQGHGVHGMQLTWLLKGPAGAVELSMFTDWVPGVLSPGHGLQSDGSYIGTNTDGTVRWPAGAGMGRHTRHPQYGGHEASGTCSLLGGECYYLLSLSGADPVVPEFLERGEQAVWDALEAAYEHIAAERQAEAAGGG